MMKATLPRMTCGAMLGTAVNGFLFTGFAWLNATPVPSLWNPIALLDFATGTWWLTLLIAFVVYTVSLLLTSISFP